MSPFRGGCSPTLTLTLSGTRPTAESSMSSQPPSSHRVRQGLTCDARRMTDRTNSRGLRRRRPTGRDKLEEVIKSEEFGVWSLDLEFGIWNLELELELELELGIGQGGMAT